MKKAFFRTIVRLVVLAVVIAIGYSAFGNITTVKLDPALASSPDGTTTTQSLSVLTNNVETAPTIPDIEVPVVEEVEEETQPEVPAPILWDKNVDLVPYYHEQDSELMSYLLYTPTNIQEGQKLPLLIWLHGSGEINASESGLRNSGLPAVLESMEMTPNAFIVCPQLDGAYNLGAWNNEGSMVSVANLVNYLVATNPAIDVENISISGHSLGGAGSMYMAQNMAFVNRVASLSVYNPRVTMTMDASDVRIFVGSASCGEDRTCIVTADDMVTKYGYTYETFECNHGQLPANVFAVNEETGECDVLTWLLTK